VTLKTHFALVGDNSIININFIILVEITSVIYFESWSFVMDFVLVFISG